MSARGDKVRPVFELGLAFLDPVRGRERLELLANDFRMKEGFGFKHGPGLWGWWSGAPA